MFKCCAFCKSYYCADESDVSGFNCRILENKKITEPYKDSGCVYFRFSLLMFIFGS
jgi:hypothetical protein